MDAESIVYMKENTQETYIPSIQKVSNWQVLKDEADEWLPGPEAREGLEVNAHKHGASIGGDLCMKIN